jgi:hypothetical protein
MINILIDELTNSIKKRETGEEFKTDLELITLEEIKILKGWQFNWASERMKRNVFKLTKIIEPDVIQGLISLEKQRGYIYVNIVENAPFNMGKTGVYQGVGGNLFAYACKVSFEMGFDGYVTFDAKTQLIKHYSIHLGAQLISSQRMVIDTLAATQLINQYFKTFKL